LTPLRAVSIHAVAARIATGAYAEFTTAEYRMPVAVSELLVHDQDYGSPS
jgi:hypothetical protein